MIAGPTGAQYGWAIGGLAAQLFTPPQKLPPTFGPRLGDLKVQASTYGANVPRVYGTARIAGNIIWSTDIIETATTETVESGGKGGSGASQSSTAYSYSQSFAVALCEGPIVGIRRIWANGELIFSLADDADGPTLLASEDVTVYLGTETQTASALMESYLGGGSVPGYRGLAYAEFDGLDLAPFGNRTPNLEFEVVQDGSAFSVTGETILYSGGSPTPTINAFLCYNQQSGKIWCCNSTTLTPAICIDIEAGTQTVDKGLTGAQLIRPLWVDDDGKLWGWNDGGGGATNTLRSIDTAGNVTSYTANLSIVAPPPGTGNEIAIGFDDSGAVYFPSSSSSVIYQCFIGSSTATLTALTNPLASIRLMHRAGDISGRMYCTTPANSGVRGWGYYDTSSLAFTTLYSFSSGTGQPGLVDADNQCIYIGSETDATKLKRFDLDGNFIDQLNLPSNNEFRNMVIDDIGNLYVDGGTPSGNSIYRIDRATFTLETTFVVSGNRGLVSGGSYLGIGPLLFNTGVNQFDVRTIYGLSLLSADPVDLGDVVSDLCQLSDLTSSDLDVTGLVGIPVDGYVIASVGPLRGMIEPLMQAFTFDAVESDNKVKFVVRGGAVAVTIAQTDLSAQGGDGDPPPPAEITRREETELPLEVTVTYIARANNYQPGTQRERRLTTRSQNKAQYSFSIVMSDDFAQQLADKLMYSAWQERASVEFSTTRKFAKYEPTDVMRLTVNGVNIDLRAETKDVGTNGIIRWGGPIVDSSVYTQTSVGATMITPSNSITLTPESVVAFADVPLLRDVDDTPGFYFGACGETFAGWRGQQLYIATDGVTYSPLSNALTISPAVIGRATTALGTAATLGQVDESRTVTVRLEDSLTLSSVTLDQLLSGSNAAMLGDEIIQFRTATLVGTDTYTLSGLLRGRLGSEAFSTTHAIGDEFLLLDPTLIRTVNHPWSYNDVEYLYKAVTFGRTLTQTSEEEFTNTSRRMKPLSPCQLVAGRDGNGDWQIAWVRRTRYQAQWLDEVDAPLGETSEAYEVDVMSGSTVVRTISATTQSASYSAANWLADFGSPTPVTLTINVYQISEEFGRGYAANGTFS